MMTDELAARIGRRLTEVHERGVRGLLEQGYQAPPIEATRQAILDFGGTEHVAADGTVWILPSPCLDDPVH